MKIKRALISVFDKSGLIELAHSLHSQGVEILSSGGTAKALAKADIPVTEVSKYTDSPEFFEGRVKTLHPKIHGGILMRRGNQKDEQEAKRYGIEPIDLVVVNLYPFEKTVAQKDATHADAIENIDIGGIALIRAAAKNSDHVTILVDPEDYKSFLADYESNGGAVSDQKRHNLMIKAFERSSHYDWAISRYFGGEGKERFPHRMKMIFERAYPLRYGENPHQQAAAYRLVGKSSLFDARIYSGKQMSYNNFADSDSALHLIREFYGKSACVILKHNNPCGVAIGHTLQEAYQKALACDPLSSFGGIVALSQRVDLDTAKAIGNKFLEVILAPGYDPEALEFLKRKPSRRILDISDLFRPIVAGDVTFKHIEGGMLYQHDDPSVYDKNSVQTVTKRQPTDQQVSDMHFAMIIAKHVKSNAIVIARDGQTIGIGAGQMSRVDAADIAISKSRASGFDLFGSSAASDAFLPFADTIEVLAKAGVVALAQPGGSKRDEEVIKDTDKLGVSMIFTGVRHFKH